MRNRTDFSGLAQRGDGVDGAGHRLVADPQAAVEVEQDVVVATEGGGDRHARRIILARRATSPRRPHRLPRPAARRLRRLLRQASPRAAPRRRTAERRKHRRPGEPVPARGLRGRREARAQGRRQARQAQGEALEVQDLRRDGLDELRRLRDHARRQARPDHRRQLQVPGRQEVLRRPDVPPDRPGLRDPGRRPGGRRLAAGRATRSWRRRRARSSTRRASSRWPRPRPRRPARRGSQFFVVTGDGRQLADARLRAARQGHRGHGRRDQDRRHPGRPEHRPARRAGR